MSSCPCSLGGLLLRQARLRRGIGILQHRDVGLGNPGLARHGLDQRRFGDVVQPEEHLAQQAAPAALLLDRRLQLALRELSRFDKDVAKARHLRRVLGASLRQVQNGFPARRVGIRLP
jgi:hypothetical protein